MKNHINWNQHLLIALFTLLFCTISIARSAEVIDIKMGVLAKRGDEIAIQRWSETATYLSHTIPAYQFSIIPLRFDEIEPAVKSQQVDFLLANSGIFVNLSFAHNLTAITTIKRHLLNNSYTKFGSVIFTRSNRKSIQNLTDLKEKKVSAVNPNSLGGWIAALREFKKENIDINDFKSLHFLETHDAVVYSVLDNKSDIGIVRTDTLERMANEGRVDLTTIKPLFSSSSYSETTHFPFLLSTRLYPEWPLAKLSHISDSLAKDVAIALMTMPTNSQAATKAKIMGWTIPKNYREVERAYSELKLGIFKKLSNNYTVGDVFKRYWNYALLTCLILTILFIYTARFRVRRV